MRCAQASLVRGDLWRCAQASPIGVPAEAQPVRRVRWGKEEMRSDRAFAPQGKTRDTEPSTTREVEKSPILPEGFSQEGFLLPANPLPFGHTPFRGNLWRCAHCLPHRGPRRSPAVRWVRWGKEEMRSDRAFRPWAETRDTEPSTTREVAKSPILPEGFQSSVRTPPFLFILSSFGAASLSVSPFPHPACPSCLCILRISPPALIGRIAKNSLFPLSPLNENPKKWYNRPV